MDELLESNSPLNAELEQACNDPEGCDCGFVEQRRASGFANFGYDPAKAHELREKELARIAGELESEPLDYSDDEDDDDFDQWEYDEDDSDLPELGDDDDEFDRHAESYGNDLEDDWRNNWDGDEE